MKKQPEPRKQGLRPGTLFGETIPQIAPGVYEVPDELLRRYTAGDIVEFASWLWATSVNAHTITVVRDFSRDSTRIVVRDRRGQAIEE